MKRLRKSISIASIVCLLMSLATFLGVPGVQAAPRRAAAKMAVEAGTQYKLSDYRDALAELVKDAGANPVAIVGVDTPWQAQVLYEGTWTTVNQAAQLDAQYVYAHFDPGNGETYGNGFYPGISMYNVEGDKRDLNRLCPAKDQWWDETVAWAFTAPAAGVYEFGRSPDDQAYAWADTQWFHTLGAGIKVAIRITVDGATIWPTEADATEHGYAITDGWAEVDTAADKVPVPTLSNLEMTEGQVLRVECKSLTACQAGLWELNTAASANMTYTGPIPPDEVAPEFPADAAVANNADAATDTTLTLSWPAATDNKTIANNMTYKVFYSTEAIESIDGLEGVTAPDKTSLTLTGLEGSTEYYVAVAAYDMAGNYALLKAGPFRTQDPPPDSVAQYEMYDYFDDISAHVFAQEGYDVAGTNIDISALETDSPWRVQLRQDKGAETGDWITANQAAYDKPNNDMYVKNVTNFDWGGNFPSVRFWRPETIPDDGRYYVSEMIPVNPNDSVNPDYKIDVAMLFTAPKAGIYTFRKANDDHSQNFDSTQYFRTSNAEDVNQQQGVRITLNGQTIWPTEADAEAGGFEIQDGWAVLPGYSDDKETWIPVPTLSGLELKAGDELRLEGKALTQGTWPWNQKFFACVAMDLNAELGPDTQAPAFAAGELAMDSASGTSLTLSWPAATDDQTSDKGIQYTVYVGKEAFTADSIPTEGGVTVTGQTQALVGELDSATEYYAAVVAQDAAGNKSTALVGGPFSTLGGGSGEDPGEPEDPDEPTLPDPTAPLTPNMDENSAGIMSSAIDKVQIGWNAASGISNYRVYLFAKTDTGYTLDQKSDVLPYSAGEYTFENLESKNYEIQVVGYNMQGDPVSVYPVIALNMVGIGDGSNPGDNTPGGDGGHTTPGDSDIPSTGERVIVPLIFLLAAVSGAVVAARMRKMQRSAC